MRRRLRRRLGPRAGARLALLGAVVALALGGPARGADFGPAPRDEHGRFANPGGPVPHGPPGVRIPFFLRRLAGAFRSRPGAPGRVDNDGAFLRENARHSVPTVTWIGHATVVVQMDHATFLTDPIWSDTASPLPFFGPRRFVPPGLDLAELPEPDFVLISHNHYDHLDLATLEEIHRRWPRTAFFVPLGNGRLLEGRGIAPVGEFDWGDSLEYRGLRVTCLPARHWSRRGLRDENRALWASWAVVGPSRRFYFAGDTGWFPGFGTVGERLGPFDLAALPIGAYEPAAMMAQVHLDPEQAIEAARALRTRRALAVHFGTFDLSDEPLAEPPRRFREAARAAGFGEDEALALRVGETRTF